MREEGGMGKGREGGKNRNKVPATLASVLGLDAVGDAARDNHLGNTGTYEIFQI